MLVYVNDVVSSATTPVRELQAYQRVTLEPGVSTTVEMEIAHDQLALFDAALQRVVEPGQFEVWVGDQKAVFEVQP